LLIALQFIRVFSLQNIAPQNRISWFQTQSYLRDLIYDICLTNP